MAFNTTGKVNLYFFPIVLLLGMECESWCALKLECNFTFVIVDFQSE